MVERPARQTESNPEATGAETIPEVVRDLAAAGWAGSFRTRPEGRVECGACGETLEGGRFGAIDVERRLEGVSDPDEMLLVLGLTCPACGVKGTAVVGYGPTASEHDTDALLALPDDADHRGDTRGSGL